jgi:hypothetical protein
MASAHDDDEDHSSMVFAHGGEVDTYDSDTASIASIKLSSKGSSPRDSTVSPSHTTVHESSTKSPIPQYFDFSSYKAIRRNPSNVVASEPFSSSPPPPLHQQRREPEDVSEKTSIIGDTSSPVFDTDVESHETRETSVSPTPDQSMGSSFTQVPSAMAMSYPPPPLGVVDPEVESTTSSLSYARKDRPESLIIDLKSGPLILGVALVDFNHLVVHPLLSSSQYTNRVQFRSDHK